MNIDLKRRFLQHNHKIQPIRRPQDKPQDEREIGPLDEARPEDEPANEPTDGLADVLEDNAEDNAEDKLQYKQQLPGKMQPTCSKCHVKGHKEAQNAALCEVEAAHEIGQTYSVQRMVQNLQRVLLTNRGARVYGGGNVGAAWLQECIFFYSN